MGLFFLLISSFAIIKNNVWIYSCLIQCINWALILSINNFTAITNALELSGNQKLAVCLQGKIGGRSPWGLCHMWTNIFCHYLLLLSPPQKTDCSLGWLKEIKRPWEQRYSRTCWIIFLWHCMRVLTGFSSSIVSHSERYSINRRLTASTALKGLLQCCTVM